MFVTMLSVGIWVKVNFRSLHHTGTKTQNWEFKTFKSKDVFEKVMSEFTEFTTSMNVLEVLSMSSLQCHM